jgi:hypothetical protein
MELAARPPPPPLLQALLCRLVVFASSVVFCSDGAGNCYYVRLSDSSSSWDLPTELALVERNVAALVAALSATTVDSIPVVHPDDMVTMTTFLAVRAALLHGRRFPAVCADCCQVSALGWEWRAYPLQGIHSCPLRLCFFPEQPGIPDAVWSRGLVRVLHVRERGEQWGPGH